MICTRQGGTLLHIPDRFQTLNDMSILHLDMITRVMCTLGLSAHFRLLLKLQFRAQREELLLIQIPRSVVDKRRHTASEVACCCVTGFQLSGPGLHSSRPIFQLHHRRPNLILSFRLPT